MTWASSRYSRVKLSSRQNSLRWRTCTKNWIWANLWQMNLTLDLPLMTRWRHLMPIMTHCTTSGCSHWTEKARRYVEQCKELIYWPIQLAARSWDGSCTTDKSALKKNLLSFDASDIKLKIREDCLTDPVLNRTMAHYQHNVEYVRHEYIRLQN